MAGSTSGTTRATRGADRRGPDRRSAQQAFEGQDRRTGDRRSGRDRRDPAPADR